MANNFRNEHPKRTFEKTYAKYGSYKPHLAKDFFNRCGYTDCPDFWFGGTRLSDGACGGKPTDSWRAEFYRR